MVKVVLPRLGLLQKLSASMTKQFVEADLHLECLIFVLVPNSLILWSNERRRLVRRRCAQDVSKRDVLETLGLSVTVRKVNIRV